jgi:hypothetical protein
VAEEGAAGYAARLIAPGRWTTGYNPQIERDKRTAKIDDGLAYNSIFAAGTYPVYTLRTDDGGALVLYTLIRTSTWITPDDNGQGVGLAYSVGRPVPIPKDAQWDLKDPYIVKERRITSTLQYAGLVPPKNTAGQAQVIGQAGFVTKATTTK